MGKVLVLYYSGEGSTARMAALVAEAAGSVPGIEVRLRSVTEASVDDIFWADGLAVGSPTHLGLISAEMKSFWERHTQALWQKIDGKIGCAFSSQGGWAGGGELACQSINTMLMNFGLLVFGVTDYVAHQFTTHYGAVVSGEPRLDREKDSCRRLGRRLAEWVAVLKDRRTEADPVRSPGYKRNPWD